MKIIVAHPGKQHSYYLCEALKKELSLLYYVTTVYNADKSWTRLVGCFLKGNNKKRFLTRKNELFDNKVVRNSELLGLIYLALIRKKGFNWIKIKIEMRIHDRVYVKSIKLAKKENADAIIVYGGFRDKHRNLIDRIHPNLKVIIDVPIITNNFMKSIFEKDIEITSDNYIKKEQSAIWDKKRLNQIKYWANHANGYLVGSNVVKKSLEFLGTDTKKIKIVPYGVDIDVFNKKNYVELENEVITFIFAGKVDRRKGIQHLLPLIDKFCNKCNLVVVGAYDEDDLLYRQYSDNKNIKFTGFVTKDQMSNLYKNADVFVLPTLGEGLAQVGIEAMSSGLPIICTEYSGVNDIVIDGYNGFVVPASNQNKLYERMEWFINNKKQIQIMGEEARKSVLNLTWDDYYKNVVNAVKEIIGK